MMRRNFWAVERNIRQRRRQRRRCSKDRREPWKCRSVNAMMDGMVDDQFRSVPFRSVRLDLHRSPCIAIVCLSGCLSVCLLACLLASFVPCCTYVVCGKRSNPGIAAVGHLSSHHFSGFLCDRTHLPHVGHDCWLLVV